MSLLYQKEGRVATITLNRPPGPQRPGPGGPGKYFSGDQAALTRTQPQSDLLPRGDGP